MNSDDLVLRQVPSKQTMLEINQQRNRSTREASGSFSHHRQIVTEFVLRSSAADKSKLCIFGAGNSNDLDLQAVVKRFAEIQLVDADPEALELSRLKYQQAATIQAREIKLFCLTTDLTGLFEHLDAQSVPALDLLVEKSQQHQLPIPESQFDCIASTCLFSQIVASLDARLGESSSLLLPLILETRRKHFELMIQHLRPGGQAVFISDFVSSVTWPELGALTPEELNQTVLRVLEHGNFFTGCNPLAIVSLLRNDWFAARISNVLLSPCWRWDLGNKQMAVAAITFRRKA